MEGSLSQLLGNKCKEVLKSSSHIVGLLKLLQHSTNSILIMKDMYSLGHLALLVVDFPKFIVLSFYLFIHIFLFSIYILSDLGELSNLIGSLSRTIQHY